MLTFDIIPERSLSTSKWEFVLGMPMAQAVALLQRDVRHIAKVEVVFCEDDVLHNDLLLHLVEQGICLIFDAVCQRLRIIEIYDLTKCMLKYNGNIFRSTDIVPTRSHVDACFGATRPPQYDVAQSSFVLNFRGICFFLPALTSTAAGASISVGGDENNDTDDEAGDVELDENHHDRASTSSSTPLPDHTYHQRAPTLPKSNHHSKVSNNYFQQQRQPRSYSPPRNAAVNRLCIFSGSSLRDARAPTSMPLSCYNNRVYADSIDVVRDGIHTAGIQVHLTCENGTLMSSATSGMSGAPVTTSNASSASSALPVHAAPSSNHQHFSNNMPGYNGATVTAIGAIISNNILVGNAHQPTLVSMSPSSASPASSSLGGGIPGNSAIVGAADDDRCRLVRTIRFNDNVQDVLTCLGAPDKVYFKTKSEEKMAIHLPKSSKSGEERGDFFFNYFTLGLDILFDGTLHKVKKFLLHSNMPGHYDFNVYCRAQFKIPLARDYAVSPRDNNNSNQYNNMLNADNTFSMPMMPRSDSMMSAVDVNNNNNNGSSGGSLVSDENQSNNNNGAAVLPFGDANISSRSGDESGGGMQSTKAATAALSLGSQQSLLDQPEPFVVSVFSKWDDVQAYVNTLHSRPIVLNRHTSLNTPNPFGETHCYGYQDMIFEIMPNGYIASVTLHQLSP